jgi:uncharacterized protein
MLEVVKRIALIVVFALVASCGAVYSARNRLFRRAFDLPEFTHELGESRIVRVKMRDGVELHTDIHLPAGKGPWPVVLMRNPYTLGVVFPLLCELTTRYGYACVTQQVRGVGDSGGDWYPVFRERDDGFDTLAWLVAQDFQDGNIALAGMSYLAATQWAVADRLPPEVKTIMPMVFGTDAYANAYERGMFKHEIMTAWAALMHDGSMHFGNGSVYRAMTRHRPAIDADAELGPQQLAWYREWLGSSSRTVGFWAAEGPGLLVHQPEKVNIPVLMIGGWYDLFLDSQLKDFERLGSRDRSRFLIGPWHHLQISEHDNPGDVGASGQLRMILGWLDHHLRGQPLDQEVGVIETYAFGEGKWHVRRDFPPAATATVTFHLDALAASNTCDGGKLIRSAPETPGAISYRYDPDDPVPTRGGEKLLGFAFRTFGCPMPESVDQSGLCERDDVLTFVSEPLEAPLHLAGKVQVELTVRSDAEDTAFTAKLIEVSADGLARNVRDGIATLRHRTSDAAEPYAPNQRVEVRLELWPIEWRFPKGSRVRLDVSSSNFPAFHAHANRAGEWASVKDPVVATQTVEGGALSLPVLR